MCFRKGCGGIYTPGQQISCLDTDGCQASPACNPEVNGLNESTDNTDDTWQPKENGAAMGMSFYQNKPTCLCTL